MKQIAITVIIVLAISINPSLSAACTSFAVYSDKTVYGMNFDPERSPWNMPELGWPGGYPFALGIMATLAVGMLVFFKKKGWI